MGPASTSGLSHGVEVATFKSRESSIEMRQREGKGGCWNETCAVRGRRLWKVFLTSLLINLSRSHFHKGEQMVPAGGQQRMMAYSSVHKWT